jgi:hypothetical protein
MAVAQWFGFLNVGPLECFVLLGLSVLLFGRDIGRLARLDKKYGAFWFLVCYYLASSCR